MINNPNNRQAVAENILKCLGQDIDLLKGGIGSGKRNGKSLGWNRKAWSPPRQKENKNDRKHEIGDEVKVDNIVNPHKGKKGIVHKIDEDGDHHVRFENSESHEFRNYELKNIKKKG